MYTFRVHVPGSGGMKTVAARWADDGGRTATTGTVSVAELCRRLGAPAPVTAGPVADPAAGRAAASSAADHGAGGGVATGAPVLVGDLLRREGHPLPETPAVPGRTSGSAAERPEPAEAD